MHISSCPSLAQTDLPRHARLILNSNSVRLNIMSTKLAPLDTTVVSARPSLTSAEKAVLAMPSTDYLALTSSDDAGNALSPVFSPLSATSTYSYLWSPTSRRCSAASDTSQDTDDSDTDGCVTSNYEEMSPWTKQAGDRAGTDVVIETPEVLAVGACIVCKDPATSRPGIILVRDWPSETETENRSHDHPYQQPHASGLWRLPQSTTIADDLSISEALARTVQRQTGLKVSRVAATLHDTRHHLHHEQDLRAFSSRMLEQHSKPELARGPKDSDQQPPTKLVPETLDELMRMIDLGCAGAAASFAAAAAARMNRNMPASSGADCCHICDFASSDLDSSPESPTRRYSRRDFVMETRRGSRSYDDEISDSYSSASSSGYASNSDESTCHLLHGEEYTDGETDEDSDDDNIEIGIATYGTNRKSSQQGMPSIHDFIIANKYTEHYSGFSYTALPQKTGDDASGFFQDAGATLDSDTESDGSIYEHDLYFSEDIGDSVSELSQPYRECLQLNYIVFVSDDPEKVAAAKATASSSQAISARTRTGTEMETALVTELDIDEWRMSPQTRDLVRQGLWWAKNFFPAPAGKISKPYATDNAQSVHDGVRRVGMPAL